MKHLIDLKPCGKRLYGYRNRRCDLPRRHDGPCGIMIPRSMPLPETIEPVPGSRRKLWRCRLCADQRSLAGQEGDDMTFPQWAKKHSHVED